MSPFKNNWTISFCLCDIFKMAYMFSDWQQYFTGNLVASKEIFRTKCLCRPYRFCVWIKIKMDFIVTPMWSWGHSLWNIDTVGNNTSFTNLTPIISLLRFKFNYDLFYIPTVLVTIYYISQRLLWVMFSLMDFNRQMRT